MPQGFSVIALFCEDIREEKSGQDTLVGILPDNMHVPSVPGMLPKLGVYLRLHLSDIHPRTVKAKLRVPGESEPIALGNLDDLVDRSKAEAEAKGLPFAGLIAKALFSPFQIKGLGQIEAVLEIDGQDYTCGAINIAIQPTTKADT